MLHSQTDRPLTPTTIPRDKKKQRYTLHAVSPPSYTAPLGPRTDFLHFWWWDACSLQLRIFPTLRSCYWLRARTHIYTCQIFEQLYASTELSVPDFRLFSNRDCISAMRETQCVVNLPWHPLHEAWSEVVVYNGYLHVFITCIVIAVA